MSIQHVPFKGQSAILRNDNVSEREYSLVDLSGNEFVWKMASKVALKFDAYSMIIYDDAYFTMWHLPLGSQPYLIPSAAGGGGGMELDDTTPVAIHEVSLGDWNMNLTMSILVPWPLGITKTNTWHIDTLVRNDTDDERKQVHGVGIYLGIYNTGVLLELGFAWGTDYDATSYNRGWMYFFYKP